MVHQKKINILFGMITILAVSFFIRDWYVFYQCGAVESCLAESSYFQHYTKFAVTTIINIIAFFVGKNSLCKRDHHLLQAAMISAILADINFKLLHNATGLSQFSGEFMLMGITFFMVFQSILIYRHTRTSDTDNEMPLILLVPFGAMLVLFALRLFNVFESPLIPTVIVYSVFLICALVTGLQVSRYKYFPTRNASLIKRGMILFFIGDICVGLSLATGPDHSVQEIIATIANNFVWYFYVPSLILLVMSGYRKT